MAVGSVTAFVFTTRVRGVLRPGRSPLSSFVVTGWGRVHRALLLAASSLAAGDRRFGCSLWPVTRNDRNPSC